ncbi:MAG: hypothetical protein EOO98_01245 [Pedobacter sp.]|nr:MAG: hypothetical protein EOO98_01245 [Pedobacter sp.]
MKKVTLLLFFLISQASQSFAQVGEESDIHNELLLKVKSVLEKNFAETKYRGIQKDFKINDSISKQYRFYGTAEGLISSVKLGKLNNQLNNVLKANKQVKIDGKIYFDFFLDSVVVDLEYCPDGIIYKFVAMSAIPAPPKGYEAFAKRMHDFLKQQLVNNKISKDSLLSNSSAKFIVRVDGTLFAAKQKHLTELLTDFLETERRWNPGLHSGPSISSKVSFILNRSYLTDENPNWPTYYGKEQMSFESLASFSTVDNEVFYSGNLPNYGKETVISVVYDSFLKRYRLPYIHVDNAGKAKELIALIINNKKTHGEDISEFRRKYYYMY